MPVLKMKTGSTEHAVLNFCRVPILGAWNVKVPNFGDAAKFWGRVLNLSFQAPQLKARWKNNWQYYLHSNLGRGFGIPGENMGCVLHFSFEVPEQKARWKKIPDLMFRSVPINNNSCNQKLCFKWECRPNNLGTFPILNQTTPA